jgi:Na+/proline symporter/signal transduction histidine kinase
MSDLLLAGLVVAAYMAALVGIARWAERQEARGRRVAHNPLVYSLSLAVYATTWTFYGSVGFAARNGLLFLTVYLGPTLVFAAGWYLLRPLIRMKDARRITGLPDLLSLRYEKSRAVALVATAVLVVGLVPYLALQLRTMIATLALLAGGSSGSRAGLAYPEAGREIGPPLVALLVLFTIAVGLRRVAPAERHPGLVLALAIESAVKLVAFLAVGAFVVWGLFDGPGEIFRLAAAPEAGAPSLLGGEGVTTWLSHLLLSAVAVVLLPRQFHVTIVENADVSHLRTAMWAFPAYLLAINAFVLPLALGALVLRGSAEGADTFVLALPLSAGETALSWAVFLGGFSAGLGMVAAETTALATMISNDVVAPTAEAWAPARVLRRHLVQTRWAAAALVLVAAFAYERAFGTSPTLVSIGFVSFAAVMQLAPALVGGLLWSGASRAGALAGMSAGFATWAYTVVVPVLARSGWLPPELLSEGPFGIEALVPEGLFDLHLDPVSHTVIWTLIANVGAFFVGSTLRPPRPAELERGRALAPGLDRPELELLPSASGPPLASAQAKRERAQALLASYFGAERAAELAEACLRRTGASGAADLSALQVAELEAQVEAALASAIGSAGAHAAVRRSGLVRGEEELAIAKAYAELLASLHVSPAELKRRVDYHRERERLLARDAAHQRFLAEVSEGIGTSLDSGAIADAAVRLAVPELADAALLFLPSAGVGVPSAAFAHVDPERTARARARIEGALDALSRSPPIVGALELRRVPPSPCRPGWPPALEGDLPCGAQIVLPLAVRRDALGVLALFADDPRQLSSPDHVALCEALARRIAIALENARLYRGAEDAVRARDRFLAVASHELKTPLTPLRIRISALERLVSRGALEHVPREKLVELFTGAEGQVMRMARLVDDLLDVTRMSLKRLRLAPEPMDLRQSAADVIERHLAEIAQSGCEVRLEASGPATGSWDRTRVEQVITNLLTNALKYAPRAAVEVRIEADEARARVVVRDHGPGIAPADQARIFRPFERASSDPEVGGFGLGLFIVREIVEAHGGALRLVSSPGGGATFEVELPRASPAQA